MRRRRRSEDAPSTPEAALVNNLEGPSVETPIGQLERSESNDFLFSDPRLQLDFERISLEVLDDEEREQPGGGGGGGAGGGRVMETAVDEARVEIGDVDERGSDLNSDDDSDHSPGQPLRIRRSDRVNKGIPPVRFQAGP